MINRIVTWNGLEGSVVRDEERATLKNKPSIQNLEFTVLYYEPATNNVWMMSNGQRVDPLTNEQQLECQSWVDAFVFPDLPIMVSVHQIDGNGEYLGYYPNHAGNREVSSAPPTSHFYRWVETEVSADWVFNHGCDVNGFYIGNVRVNNATYLATSAPPSSEYRWNNVTKEWEDVRGLDDLKLRVLAKVDMLAGNARMRYISDAPGQAETYLMKAEQAAAWMAADPTSRDVANYPMIEAELSALKVDDELATEEVAALYILNTKAMWVQKASSIEAIRRQHKVRIANAATNAEIDSLLLSAQAAFAGQ